MLWIKRNLFLAVGGLVALVLLGLGVWILISGIQENRDLDAKVEAARGALNNFYTSSEPFPSSNNIEIARKESEKLRDAAKRSKKYFQPVPFEKVTGLAFRTYRDNTIDELRKQAAAANTELPTKTYAFSFMVQKDRTDFSPSTYPIVPQQMAEVKAICSVLFDARVPRLGNLRRAKVSDEDIRAGGTDYHSLPIETNAQAEIISSPYELTFYGYSSQLAQIMNSFNRSSFGLVMKVLQVEPEDGVKLEVPGGQPPPPDPLPPRPGGPPPPRRAFPGQPGAPRPGTPPPIVRPQAAAATAAARRPADRPVILLNEKRLKVTVLLYVVKPLK